MSTIKIISNPYNRKISFETFNERIGAWEDIKNNNPNSRLREDETGKMFLPFKIKDIIDVIIDEYQSGSEKVSVIFQGTQDEYDEVKSVCAEDEIKDKVSLKRDPIILENASLIFKETKEIFEAVHPVIEKIIKDDKKIVADLNKVSDALNNIIPICVFGNYSAGKSTFINALIGHEILPSGGDPITAKIFKIQRSERDDTSVIFFSVGEEAYQIAFQGDEARIIKGDSSKQIVKDLMAAVTGSEKDIFSMVKTALDFLNGYEKKNSETKVGSVIDIEVPFSAKGIMGQSFKHYVIIDTPGSNTATYAEHAKVLEEALDGLSNGIPVWVSVYESIDSEDNANLCEKIDRIQALDKRFTMIVLNKADGSDLGEDLFDPEHIKEVLEYTAVEKMYSSGIFFVSSIMGLGAKNDGELVDKHYRRIYRSLQDMYSDPEDEDYATLYQYNIMPEQIKEKALEYSKECSDLVYANSGLYCVEREIENFGSKHSAYNKCQMVYLFLSDVIDKTNDRITARTDSLKRTRALRENELDKTKKDLINSIVNKADEMQYKFDRESKIHVKDFVVKNMNYSRSVDEMEADDKLIRDGKFDESDFADQTQEYEESKQSFWSHLKENAQGMFTGNFLDSAKNLFGDIARDSKELFEKRKDTISTGKEIDKVASDKMLQHVVKEYRRSITSADEALSQHLKGYWYQLTQDFKNQLIAIITGSEALSVTQREEISNIIINYEPFEIKDDTDMVFIKKKFLRGNFLWFSSSDSEKLNIRLLTLRYNDRIKRNVSEMAFQMNDSCFKSFIAWALRLNSVIEENITDYNPNLRDMAAMIKEETDKILELENDQKAICASLDTIKSFMSWKSINLEQE